MIVLGSFPEYLEEAGRRGANALTVTARMWQFFANTGEQWTVSQSFLDEILRSKQEILLVTNPAAVSTGSTTMQELTHFIRHGFYLDPSGTRLLHTK
jgi:hypothetical protein